MRGLILGLLVNLVSLQHVVCFTTSIMHRYIFLLTSPKLNFWPALRRWGLIDARYFVLIEGVEDEQSSWFSRIFLTAAYEVYQLDYRRNFLWTKLFTAYHVQMAFFYLLNYFNILSIVTEKFNQLGIFGTFSYISLTEMKDMRMQWNIISLCWIMSLLT